jgi:hypothetical protein
VEGGEQALIEGAPEAEFGGDATAEPVEDVEPVSPFGGGGEAEQQLGAEVIEPAAIAGGGGVGPPARGVERKCNTRIDAQIDFRNSVPDPGEPFISLYGRSKQKMLLT